MKNLFDYDLATLQTEFVAAGEKKFRAAQVMQWLYHEGVCDISQMTNLAKSLRATLSEQYDVSLPTITTVKESRDGTVKWLMNVDEKNAIEVVFIPEDDRGTLCISSQAGCALACPFCSTGHSGFNRNLSTAEIIGQVWIAMRHLGWEKAGKRKITNIVFMGMGEPLMNYKAVTRAANILTSDHGFGLSKRRVTISTSGIVPKIRSLNADCDVSLAISLHAPNDKLRDVVVPINRTYNLEALMSACREFVDVEHGGKKHITWEYVMLDGINDSKADALALAKLVRDLPGKVNLIPFNPFPGASYKTSKATVIEHFKNTLIKSGITTTVRKTRGDDIEAACGQLAGEINDRSRRERILVRHN